MLAVADSFPSWRMDSTPLVFSEFFKATTSVAAWQRGVNKEIEHYFERVFNALGLGLRNVFDMQSIQQQLTELLPDAAGKSAAVEDIVLIADMLTCLFGCNRVGLRLVPLQEAMCARFHVDRIPVRMVTTYLGDGTQWLPAEVVNYSALQQPVSMDNQQAELYQHESQIAQLNVFDVALLKGSEWAQGHLAAVHRSCPQVKNTKRVLVTLDPM